MFAARPRAQLRPDPGLPLRLYESAVDPAWVDYNGHMTEARYGDLFAYATDAFLRHVGLDAAYLAGGHSLYTVETHIRYLHEVAALEPVVVATQVLGSDEKRLHLFHTLSTAVTARRSRRVSTCCCTWTRRGACVPMREPSRGRVAAATPPTPRSPGPRARAARSGCGRR